MIEVKELIKDYGPHRAVDGLSFSVAKGEILGFLGPNGAGKTTTMRILTCFFPATSGEARVAGYDCFEESMEVRKRIGYLPENVPLYLDMRVSDYLKFVAGLKGVGAKDITGRVTGVLGDCGIEGVSGKLIGQLSKGYRQRVGLAQALVGDHDVLILDEPTIGLDPKQVIEIRKLIKDLAGRRTVILSSHILPEISMLCKRVVIINKGKLVAVDTPENLTSGLQKSSRISVHVAGPPEEVLRKLRAIEGVKRVKKGEAASGVSTVFTIDLDRDSDVRTDIPRVIVNNGWDLHEMKSTEMSLEDIFIKLVTREEEVSK